MCRIALVRFPPKSGVLAALAAATALLAVSAPASAGLQSDSPSSGGEGFKTTIRFSPLVSYGRRTTISGRISQGGWKITLFLRAAGEGRFHAAGSVTLGRSGHNFSL